MSEREEDETNKMVLELNNDSNIIIQELTQRLDAAKMKIQKQVEEKGNDPPNNHTNLLQLVMEQTVNLEAQTMGPAPIEIVQMMENTKKFEA
eukprot:15330168-Ditylum_brightwellii.AAC.1